MFQRTTPKTKKRKVIDSEQFNGLLPFQLAQSNTSSYNFQKHLTQPSSSNLPKLTEFQPEALNNMNSATVIKLPNNSLTESSPMVPKIKVTLGSQEKSGNKENVDTKMEFVISDEEDADMKNFLNQVV